MKKVGNLWEYDLQQGSLKPVETFKNMQPEGVAVSQDSQTLTIVSDGGGDRSSGFINIGIR